MSNADRRSTHTDALETLGTIIGPDEQRDAIHLAVEPAVAGDRLHPGQHVGFLPDGRIGDCDEDDFVGIVDPFITGMIEPGQRFWLVVYPRQITSLRHVWTHPAFDGAKEAAPKPISQAERSRLWIEDFAAKLDFTYNRLMIAASEWLNDGQYTYDNEMMYKKHDDQFSAFWVHYEIVTGETVKNKDRQSFFSCSC